MCNIIINCQLIGHLYFSWDIGYLTLNIVFLDLINTKCSSQSAHCTCCFYDYQSRKRSRTSQKSTKSVCTMQQSRLKYVHTRNISTSGQMAFYMDRIDHDETEFARCLQFWHINLNTVNFISLAIQMLFIQLPVPQLNVCLVLVV